MTKGITAHVLDWLGLGSEEVGGDPFGYPDERLTSQGTEGDDEGQLIPLPRRQNQAINCPIVRAEPQTMDEATAVADEIKRQNPVLLNLEEVEREEARRIRDFLGGVTYGLNGYMRKVGSWVYVCAPFDMPVEKLVLDPSRQGPDRFEADFAAEFVEQY